MVCTNLFKERYFAAFSIAIFIGLTLSNYFLKKGKKVNLIHFLLSKWTKCVLGKEIECLIPTQSEERLMGTRKTFPGAQEYRQIMKVLLSISFVLF